MKSYFFGLLALIVCSSGQNQLYVRSNRVQTDSLIGTWTGTSICQVKNSPCHDEIAVYHFSKGKGSNVYNCQGNKMVNGKEEEMGLIVYVYDEKTKTLTGHFGSHDKWTLKVKGNIMDGTLVMNDSVLYRVIHVEKVN